MQALTFECSFWNVEILENGAISLLLALRLKGRKAKFDTRHQSNRASSSPSWAAVLLVASAEQKALEYWADVKMLEDMKARLTAHATLPEVAATLRQSAAWGHQQHG